MVVAKIGRISCDVGVGVMMWILSSKVVSLSVSILIAVVWCAWYSCLQGQIVECS